MFKTRETPRYLFFFQSKYKILVIKGTNNSNHPFSPLVFLHFLLQMQEFWSTGVLTAKTRCWAQGMDGWRPLQAIPQLKWCLLATGQAVMNESDLATLILNMLITMCSYYPSRWVMQKIPLWLYIWNIPPFITCLFTFHSGTKIMLLSVLYPRSRGWSVTMLVSLTLFRYLHIQICIFLPIFSRYIQFADMLN